MVDFIIFLFFLVTVLLSPRQHRAPAAAPPPPVPLPGHRAYDRACALGLLYTLLYVLFARYRSPGEQEEIQNRREIRKPGRKVFGKYYL